MGVPAPRPRALSPRRLPEGDAATARAGDAGRTRSGDEDACTHADGAREAAMLVLLSTACYLNSLWGEFVFDDIIAVMENKDVRPETPLATIFEAKFPKSPIYSDLTS